MSRIGRKSISAPKGVKVSLSEGSIGVEGPKGSLTMPILPKINVAYDDAASEVNVSIDEKDADDRFMKAMWGTTRANINNMMVGVTDGYQKKLKIEGVGWTADLAGQTLKLKVGFANIIELPVPTGLTVAVEKQQEISVSGADKQAVGQFAAKVRSQRKPEPYNGKGIRYADEVIQRKSGKAFGK